MEKTKKIWKKRRPMTLRASMTIILSICWILPLSLVLGMLLRFTYSTIADKTKQSIIDSMDSATDICVSRLQDSVTASKNASYLPTIRQSYQKYLAGGLKIDLYEETSLFIEQQYKYDDRFLITSIYYNDDPSAAYFVYNIKVKGDYDSIKYYQNNVLPSIQEVAQNLSTGIGIYNYEGHVFMIRNIMNSSFTPYAVIVMELNPGVLFDGLESVWGYENGSLYVDGTLVYGEDTGYYDERMEQITKHPVYSHKGFNSYIYKTVKFEGKALTFLVKLDSNAIVNETEPIGYVTVYGIILLIPLILIVFWFFRKKVTRPIKELTMAAKEITAGNYGNTNLNIVSSNEFAYLGEKFNRMSDELQHQFEQIYLEELALRDAEIMALQSQINPHFLNNTLEIINWEARLGGNYKVSSMIEALSTILNATMNRKKESLIPLSEELSYVDAYFFIIAARLGERFHVEKKIEEAYLQSYVPRLIIQPIIENAVEHGMNTQNQGQVTLDIYGIGDFLYIDVINNGKLSQKDKDKIDKLLADDAEEPVGSTSLGIRNVNKRIKIIFGKDCGLSIKSDKDGNTVSRISVKITKH